MRSLSRAVVVSALALPLAIGGAGLASASGGDNGHNGDHGWDSYHSETHKKKVEKNFDWDWKWDWTYVNISDNKVINAGIINR
ncbi:hypothetical protein [Haloactinomyces albus]|uniref:Lipoprotein n=1 Tax=Haloactinomyces albus TaxID=1352928 RepID=A0AAE4CLX8_9ACTN|nr:hypothetical protein [Haloactinomyces albus]MDR7301811.1 hypothetical protein [Haloactinomyces albus]